MRVIFMGSPDFAVASLKKLHQDGVEIVAVVTGPDKRRGRGNETSPTPVKHEANTLGLNVIEADNLKDTGLHSEFSSLKPDLFVVVAFRILPPEMLKIPKIGSINLHASLLPKYRGAAPIHRAVMNGDSETGATIFFLDENVDTGNYIAQTKIKIAPHETTGEVYQRLMKLGADLLSDAIRDIKSGKYKLQKQDKTQVSLAPKLFTKDCIIDFAKPAEDVHNQIRGLSPVPAAFTLIDQKRLKIYKSKPIPNVSIPQGEYHIVDEKPVIGCKSGAVELLEVQLEGKKATDGTSFAHGYSGEGHISTPKI